MSPLERLARAERYTLWTKHDGLADALSGIRSTYIERIAKLDPADKGFADAARILGIAAKIVDQVSAHIAATVADGAVAEQDIARMERDKSLSPQRRRFI